MTTIGIVGAGVAGVHLALYLQKHGVAATLYSDRSPDEMRAARLPASVALMGATQARDAELGTNHWSAPEQGTHQINIRVAGEPPLVISGHPDAPFLFIDMRVYLPRLMADLAARGGKIVVAPCDAEGVVRLGADHDLVIVATGRDGLTAMFPRLPERSPYDAPQRRLCAGLFRGVNAARPFEMEFNIAPGTGEIFVNQFLMRDGYATVLLFEAIPGGALEPLTHLRYEDDPAAFNATALAAVRDHAPATFARIDPAAFALTGPLDTLHGAIVPTVRRGWAPLGGGTFAMAVGDTHVNNDPIVGQGANAASRAAWLLGELVVARARAGGRFDESFCVESEQQLWESVRPTTEWTNAFLQPPPPHAISLLVAAAQNQAIADAFVTNFNYPRRQWDVLSSPDATAAFIGSFAAAPTCSRDAAQPGHVAGGTGVG